MSIVVTARATAKEGCEGALEKVIRAVIAPTHAEEGCLKYALHQSLEDSKQFILVEKWSSKAAWEKHLGMPHIQNLFKQLPGLVMSPPEMQAFSEILEGQVDKSSL